jgi:hypothetical protein
MQFQPEHLLNCFITNQAIIHAFGTIGNRIIEREEGGQFMDSYLNNVNWSSYAKASAD